MTALVVAPHPDDAELAGATLLGPDTSILCLTHAMDERGAEAARAAKVTGCELIQLDLPDGDLGPAALLCQVVEEWVQHFRPSIVAGPPLIGEHQDHRAAAVAIRSATRRSALTVVEYETPSTPPDWTPDTFVPLSAAILERRKLALDEYATQQHHPYLNSELLHARARWRGQRIGVAAAEAYRTVRRSTL